MAVVKTLQNTVQTTISPVKTQEDMKNVLLGKHMAAQRMLHIIFYCYHIVTSLSVMFFVFMFLVRPFSPQVAPHINATEGATSILHSN